MSLKTIDTWSRRRVAFSTLLVIFLVAISGFTGAQEQPTFAATLDNQLGLTFSPDGKTAYWVEWNGAWGSRDRGQRGIYTARQENGIWSKPEPAPFSQRYSDEDPFVSPDGHWLYFVSDRPINDADEKFDANIWRYSLVEKDRVEYLSINSESAEYSPVMTSSGALYFASARDGGPGEGDIYRAAPQGDEFGPAEVLGPAINSHTGEWNLWVSSDENELIFEASSRPTNVSVSGDLYYSWRTPAGWTAAVPIEDLNSGGSDLMPRLHPDGNTLYYTTAPIGGHARIATTDWGRSSTQLRAAYAPILLVANRASHEVTFVDLARGEIVARIATGEGPHLLSNVSDGRVLATGYGEFPRPHAEPISRRPPFVESPNSRLTLIDVINRTVLLDRVIENCAKPHASWIVAQRAYVTCETEKRLLALDLKNGEAVGFFDTRQEGSHVLGFVPGLRTLAVSNTDSGSLTLISIDNGETRILALADGSEGLLVRADRIWVGNAWDGSVSVVDSHTASVVTQIDSVCDFPIALSSDPQEHVWVACFGSAELVSINSDTLVVERRISLDDQPLNLLLHPGLELAYVSFPRKNAIAEIDLRSGRELRRIVVGIEPDGLRWAKP
ncbi:MAG: hypothetical protein OEU40_10985 [Gammaproteobacteria bacterium]|nr:hypothetical protein [Gammaproteobacteria bacterium]